MPREILRFDQYRKRKLNEDADPTLAGAASAPGATPTPGAPLAGGTPPAGTPPADPNVPATDPTTGLPTAAPTSSGLPDPLSAGGAPADPASAGKQAIPTYKMIFIDDEVNWETRNSDGGGTKKYTEYEIEEPALDQWLADKGWTEDKPEFTKMLTGEKYKVDAKKIESLRKAIESDEIGDDMGKLEVDFDANQEIYISDLDVSFVTKNNES